MEIKTPPASFFLKKASGLKGGSATAGKETSGSVTSKQIRDIAESKMKDLNANDIDAAMQIILGSARSMGIEVKD
jgi:large subunit ribosomal protein L11